MKIAAYQASLAVCDTTQAIADIRQQVERCESLGVELLCCPEGVLGGLADYSPDPFGIAIDVEQLHDVLAPLASDTVTSIVGFSELAHDGALYNSAAVFHRGSVTGVYRKLHPAINRSVYQPGNEITVFTTGSLTFGIVICRDSSFPELARAMVSNGATALFIPTNNGLPADRDVSGLGAEALTSDIACAIEHGIAVVRADVAGRARGLVSFGSSAIVGCDGALLTAARELEPELLVAEI